MSSMLLTERGGRERAGPDVGFLEPSLNRNPYRVPKSALPSAFHPFHLMHVFFRGVRSHAYFPRVGGERAAMCSALFTWRQRQLGNSERVCDKRLFWLIGGPASSGCLFARRLKEARSRHRACQRLLRIVLPSCPRRFRTNILAPRGQGRTALLYYSIHTMQTVPLIG